MNDWQAAWQYIGLFIGIFFVTFAIFTFRDSPEQFGLEPDGGKIIAKRKNSPKFHPDKNYTLKEARFTYNF